jgi:hypothetical protein
MSLANGEIRHPFACSDAGRLVRIVRWVCLCFLGTGRVPFSDGDGTAGSKASGDARGDDQADDRRHAHGNRRMAAAAAVMPRRPVRPVPLPTIHLYSHKVRRSGDLFCPPAGRLPCEGEREAATLGSWWWRLSPSAQRADLGAAPGNPQRSPPCSDIQSHHSGLPNGYI